MSPSDLLAHSLRKAVPRCHQWDALMHNQSFADLNTGVCLRHV
jgi:hypothetical protein